MRLFFRLAPAVLGACAVGGVIPQGRPHSALAEAWGEGGAHVIVALGLNRVFDRWWFLLLLGALGVNLAACSIQRMRALHPGVWLSHLGLLVILAGGVIGGVWGVRGTLALAEGQTRAEAAGRRASFPLPFAVTLDEFRVEHHGGARHELDLLAAPADPVANAALVEGRAVALGDGVSAKLLAAYPDFVMLDHGPGTRSDNPRNPAALVEVSWAARRETFWLFERFPLFYRDHGGDEEVPLLGYRYVPPQVRQFTSELSISEGGKTVREQAVWVNRPLRHKGYTLYQSGYDPDGPEVSILQVSRTPGLGVVYAGFVILPVGIFLSLYGRPRP